MAVGLPERGVAEVGVPQAGATERLPVMAEGVETGAAADLLAALGCDLACPPE
ncbi:hypothetical protein GCM10009557_07780 [Virgisporangium ochraceum]|uniref:EAL domain-containing protein n=1 Tax=Virgisporangium ochraceum TaxID=65505 RepID=A0A8J4A023_9ACTN|nr:hypothetical protein [Virgisporangium ochraceum]GIJ72706.1 hypothetical protein Voc01_076230 [Virgisporangium ochraceum]